MRVGIGMTWVGGGGAPQGLTIWTQFGPQLEGVSVPAAGAHDVSSEP